MNILKKGFVFVLALSMLLGDVSVSFAARKTKVRKSSTSRKGSHRSASSKSVRASSTRRAAANKKRVAVGGTNTASNSSSTETSTASTKATVCRTAYSECMDMQIAGFLSKYAYLGEDPSVEIIQEGSEPLRCIYYYDVNNLNTETAKTTTDKNVNNLYYGYNYYCEPELGTGNDGQPINKCKWNTNNGTYATRGSYAFYKEAYDRLKSDELTILNFTQTKLYQNKFKSVMGDSVDLSTYSVSTDDVSDMLKSLGLDTGVVSSKENVTLFSVNVTPPVGAGTLDPKGIFTKAHDICMGNMTVPTATQSGLTDADITELKKYIKTLGGSACQSLNDEYIAYYQKGVWEGCPAGYKYNSSDSTCVSKSNSEETAELTEIDTGFLSAKNSCSLYESALISSRDQIYAKFQDQMTNYLNDNLAQLIKKEAKNQSTITSAFNTLYKADAQNKISKTQTESEISKLKAQAEADKAQIAADSAATIAKAKAQQSKAELEQAQAEANAIIEKAKAEQAKVEATAKAEQVKLEATAKAEKFEQDKAEISKIVSAGDINWDDKSKRTEVSISGSGTLGIGLYKVVVAGAAGGTSADSGVFLKWCGGNSGGNGDVKTQIFKVTSGEVNYTMTTGKKPGKPGRPKVCSSGSNGSNGPNSTFVISGLVNITAQGGEGGISDSGGCGSSKCNGGRNGKGAGSAQNSGDGYVKLYKANL